MAARLELTVRPVEGKTVQECMGNKISVRQQSVKKFAKRSVSSYTHRTSNLNLHKVGFLVIATGTCRHGAVHVFPGGGSSQDVIHFFAFGGCFDTLCPHNRTRIGTCRA